MLAYAENGAPVDGALRLVVPGEWGYKWIYSITDIQLVNYNFLGTDESMGYDDNGVAAENSNFPPSFSNMPSPAPTFSPFPAPQFSTAPSPTVSPSSSPYSTESPSPTLAAPKQLSKQPPSMTNYVFLLLLRSWLRRQHLL